MRYLVTLIGIVCFAVPCFGQLSIETAREASRKFRMSSYSYHEGFVGHAGYGAPLILTMDGGAAAFGSGDEGSMLIKFHSNGQVEWKRPIPAKGDEMELQSVVQDKNGDFYVFMLVYERNKYRGGTERAAFIDKKGTIVWDKPLGSASLLNNPTISYIRALPDGRIALRGHVVKQSPPKGQDPTYLFWEGWLDSKGKLTEKTGAAIDWKKTEEWKSRLKPEN